MSEQPLKPEISGVWDVIAEYAQALDAGTAQRIVDLFAPDGTSTIAGIATYCGAEELLAGYSAMVPAEHQLHLTSNTSVERTDPTSVRANSDLAFFKRDGSGWATQLVGHYSDVLEYQAGRWRFRERTLTLQM